MAVLLYSIVMVSAGVLARHYELRPIPAVTKLLKSIQKAIIIPRMGDSKFINDVLTRNYHVNTSVPEIPVRSIDTSRLPLLLQEVPLGNTGEFAANNGGGALAKAGQSLLVMDKLRNIFLFDLTTRSLRKLDYGVFPNGIGDAILDTKDSLPLSAVRALYMAYDPVTSTLFVSLLKFNVLSRHSRFNISAITVDKNTLAGC